ALDAPRFMYQQGREYIIENSYDAAAYPDLEARGHILKESESLFFGGGQVIMVDPESGALMAGSEPRNDGCAVAY
ncbi:MAG TPA: gamma-glutamyltransferase, partial [Chloroflexi bacterium]|nr:gamma-glutamyltransferase [Chloroflexota bacterium]